MAGSSNGREENYWPAFVDVLSNVVLTLVFVLVVFVFGMALSANKVEQRMQEIIKAEKILKEKQEAQAAPSPTPVPVAPPAPTAASEAEVIETQSPQQEDITPGKTAHINMEQKEKRISIHYPLSGVKLDQQSQERLEKLMDGMHKAINIRQVTLMSYAGKESFSVAQRLAYYRALYVRKLLIENNIAKAEDIHSKVLQSDDSGVGHVEIIFQDR